MKKKVRPASACQPLVSYTTSYTHEVNIYASYTSFWATYAYITYW